jgi:hypothetical protein
MRRAPRFTEKLLVVADDIPNSVAALSWYPFGYGNTLEQILTAHNLRSEGELKGTLPRTFANYLQEVTPVLALATSCLANPAASFADGCPGDLKIIMIALDSLGEQPWQLDPLQEFLAGLPQALYLIQVCRDETAESLLPYIDPADNLLITNPEIFFKQTDLENFLHSYRETLVNIWRGIVQNPFDARCKENVFKEPYIDPRHGQFMKKDSRPGMAMNRICRQYNRVLPLLAAEARDVAMVKRLSIEQTINLGRAAAVQEFLMSLIKEEVRRQPEYPVSVAGIRQSLFALPVDEPFKLRELQPVELIVIRPAVARRQPDPFQCQILAELGFNPGVMAVVHFDRSEIGIKLEALEDLVTVEPISAELPLWSSLNTSGRFGMSEISLGLRVEESFFRPRDKNYDNRGSLLP